MARRLAVHKRSMDLVCPLCGARSASSAGLSRLPGAACIALLNCRRVGAGMCAAAVCHSRTVSGYATALASVGVLMLSASDVWSQDGAPGAAAKKLAVVVAHADDEVAVAHILARY